MSKSLFMRSQHIIVSRVPARLSDFRFAISVSVPCSAALGASLLPSAGKASTSCSGRFFCCRPAHKSPPLPCPFFYSPSSTVRDVESFLPARPILFAPPFGIGVPHQPCLLPD